MDLPPALSLLASVVSVASKACEVVRSVLISKDLQIFEKGKSDLQTKADRNSQLCIVHSLKYNFPSLCVIGEEGELQSNDVSLCKDLDKYVLAQDCPKEFSDKKIGDFVVWVDPLDGTNEFVQGLVGHVTVLIGIAAEGRPVGGVIAQPFYVEGSKEIVDSNNIVAKSVPRIIWSFEGMGLHGLTPSLPFDKLQNTKLPFPIDPSVKPGDVHHTIVTTRSHPTALVTRAIEACSPTEVLRLGGCGYKVLSLLEGRAHAYLFASPGCKKWDTCAPEALLKASGGRLTDLTGKPYSYFSDVKHGNDLGVLATPCASWHNAYVDCLRNSGIIDELTQI